MAGRPHGLGMEQLGMLVKQESFPYTNNGGGYSTATLCSSVLCKRIERMAHTNPLRMKTVREVIKKKKYL